MADTDYFNKEETLEQHQQMTSAITTEIQGVQSSINVQISKLSEQSEKLATQNEEILAVFNALLLAFKITKTGTTWLYKAAIWLAPFIVAAAVIWQFVKGGLASVLIRFTP